jgi:DNA polymerase-3 subunit epsilon
VLLSRRLWPDAPNHKLSTLGDYCGLERSGRAHRALSDAELTARVLLRLQKTVARQFELALQGQPVTHALLCQLQRSAKHRMAHTVERHARAGAEPD